MAKTNYFQGYKEKKTQNNKNPHHTTTKTPKQKQRKTPLPLFLGCDQLNFFSLVEYK